MSPRYGNTLRHIPKGIWVLGFVSMLMDISSEMIHSLLPLFMVTTLGTSVLTVGIIEGRIHRFNHKSIFRGNKRLYRQTQKPCPV